MTFDSDFLKKLEHLSLVSRRTFHGLFPAKKKTRRLGSGMEFVKHQEYALGDDLRYLDWNVYARLGSQLIKRFEHEEDLCVTLLLDCSRSMAGERNSKFDFARKITAALAYIALADDDHVRVCAFSCKIGQISPLIRGKSSLGTLLRFLEKLEIQEGITDFMAVARTFLLRKFRTGPAIVMSDFYDLAGFQHGIDTLCYGNFEPWLVQIHEPEEATPPFYGNVKLRDVESGTARQMTISENERQHYHMKFCAFLNSVRQYCREHRLNGTISSTSVSFDSLVLRMIREAHLFDPNDYEI